MALALLGKKLAIACCSLFLSRFQGFQIAGFLVLIFAGGMAQVLLRPYYFPVYDQIELVFALLLSTILVAGMISYSSGASADPSAHDPKVFVTIVVASSIIALVLTAASFVVRDVREIARDRRAQRNGSGVESEHAKRLRALNASNLQDVDDPDAFLSSLRTNKMPTNDDRNRLAFGSVEMTTLAAGLPHEGK
eukprot:a681934_4.p1 GENE.a681934_4~~a681934_4.p1  ORF type:complete len:211 (-),score=56.41 a681934_4:9-587(-)